MLMKIEKGIKNDSIVKMLQAAPQKYRKVFETALMRTMDIARQRVVERVVPSGATAGRGGNLQYVQTPGATIQRRRRGIPWGPPIFNEDKIITRSKDFISNFLTPHGGVIMRLENKTNEIAGIFGMPGTQKYKGLELYGGKSGRKPKQPLWKALQFASRRFTTILKDEYEIVTRELNRG